jgi:F0F1-type ATP synthase assembly protein I
MSPEKQPKSLWFLWGVYGAASFQIFVSVAVFFYLGQWADAKWSTSPWLMSIGVFLGAIAGFVNLFMIVRKMEDDV